MLPFVHRVIGIMLRRFLGYLLLSIKLALHRPQTTTKNHLVDHQAGHTQCCRRYINSHQLTEGVVPHAIWVDWYWCHGSIEKNNSFLFNYSITQNGNRYTIQV
jgi:hypothetical protein